MKHGLLAWMVAIATVAGVGGHATRADDDPMFATPVKESRDGICGDCQCAGHTEAGPRRPVIRWLRERRPVRRVVRGAGRVLVGLLPGR